MRSVLVCLVPLRWLIRSLLPAVVSRPPVAPSLVKLAMSFSAQNPPQLSIQTSSNCLEFNRNPAGVKTPLCECGVSRGGVALGK